MGKKQPKCKTCKKTFSSSYSLSRHEKIHTGIKNFACNYCERKFTDPSTLIQHERLHTGEKPYKCNTCAKAFVKKYDLNKHAITHTKLKPFKCEICEVRYNRKDVLKLHLKKHEQGLIDASTIKRVSTLLENEIIHPPYKNCTKTTTKAAAQRKSLRIRRRYGKTDSDSDDFLKLNKSSANSCNEDYVNNSSTDRCNEVCIDNFSTDTCNEDCVNNSSTDSCNKDCVIKKNERLKKVNDDKDKYILNSIVDSYIPKAGKIENFSDNYKELNMNDIFDKDIQLELQELCNEIQKAIKSTLSNYE